MVGLLLSSLPSEVSSPQRKKKTINWKVTQILPLVDLKHSLVSYLYQGNSQVLTMALHNVPHPSPPGISMASSATLFFAHASTSTLASLLSFQRKTHFYVHWILLCLECSSTDAYMVHILAPPSLCSNISHPLWGFTWPLISFNFISLPALRSSLLFSTFWIAFVALYCIISFISLLSLFFFSPK